MGQYPKGLYGLEVDEEIPSKSYSDFKGAAQALIKSGRGFWNVGMADELRYSSMTDLKAILDKNKDLDTARFKGAILTGKAENLQQLAGKEWIYASSIRAIAPNRPYYKLDKE